MKQRGKKLVKVESNGTIATAHFSDGSSESGDLLIGAEGAHSIVRDFLVGRDKATLTKLPIVAHATITTLPEDVGTKFQEIHPRNVVGFHPSGLFSWVGGELCIGIGSRT